MSVGIVSFLDTSDSSTLNKYTVDTYSQLSAIVGAEEGDLAHIRNTTGNLNPFANTNLKGLYELKSGVWEYGNEELQNKLATQEAEIAANNALILSNDTDISNLQTGKTDRGGYVGTSQDLLNEIRKKTWADYIYSTSPLMNQTTLFEPYFIQDVFPGLNNGIWTFQAPFTGEYIVRPYCRTSINTTGSNFETHVLIDGNFRIPVHVESKDSAGPGTQVPTVQNSQLTGNTVDTSTDQYLNHMGQFIINKNAGDTISMKPEFRGQFNNLEATIYEYFLSIEFKEKNVV